MKRNKCVVLMIILGLIMMSACQNTQTTPEPTPLPTETPAPIATAEPSPTPQPEPTAVPELADVQIISGVPYVEGGDPRQISDIYFLPGQQEPYPTLLLLLHSLDGQYVAEQAQELAKSGYAVVVSDQRLPGTGNYLPRLEDSFCALAWIYANAETYPFDLERVFVMAYGVNAVIAVQMGFGEDASDYLNGCPYQLPEGQVLRGIITQAGVFDFTDLSDAPYLQTGIEEQFLGVPYDDNPDLWTETSVQLRVNAGLPPHLLITPEDFEMVPKSLSETYAAALQKVDVNATVLAVPDTDFFTILVHPETTAAIQTFMAEF